MKSLLSFVLIICSLNFLNAQLLEIGPITTNSNLYVQNLTAANQHKSTACGLDTVQYPLAKATSLAALNINSSTSAGAAGQYYDAPQAITISGFEFFAYSITQPSINVLAQLYTAGPDSLPIGVPLASVTVAVDSTFGAGTLEVLRKTAVFTTPITVGVPYVIVISNNSANGMGLISSSYASADGQQEWLSSLLIGATWLNGYDVNVGGTTFDADWLLHPIVSYSLTASFTASPACITAPSTSVVFANNSSGVLANRMYNQAVYLGMQSFSYSWDFGNGTNPAYAFDTTVTFTGPAQYNVSLTDTIYGWTSTCFHDTTVTLETRPIANFGSANNSLSVSYYDTSIYAISRLWDFGDGNTSATTSPTHTYAAPGTYTVCLIANNSCGGDTICKSITVSCSEPVANFSAVSNAYTAVFTDLSTGMIGGSSWSWDYGDGNTSSIQNPTHTYAATGTYTVCLIAQTVCGSDTLCKDIEIECARPIANFNNNVNLLDVSFTNTSTSPLTPSYIWDFGDGTTSALTNPSHTYAVMGAYSVCLIVSNICGADTLCKTVNVGCNLPVASYTIDNSNSPSFTFTSTSTTTGIPSYSWDFGDGASASTAFTTHTFGTTQLSYEVCLIVSDACGQDTACTNIDVTTGIQDFSEIGMRLYPNPSTGVISLEFEKAQGGYTANVLNALGQIVYSQIVDLQFNTIDLSNLNNGLYFLEIRNQDVQYVQKLQLK